MSKSIISGKCSSCKQVKSLSEFYKNRTRQNGHAYICKICCSEYQKTLKGKASQKRYWQSEKGKTNRRCYEQSKKGKIGRKRFHISHPERRKASNAINNAITMGKLPRPDTLQCHYGNHPAEQYHHPDYSKPLDVIPACKKCHRKIAV